MSNNRIYFAHSAVGITELGSSTFTEIHGLQEVGINSDVPIIDINEIGQLEIYESAEDVPEIEVTLNKVLDGYPLIYHLATPGATSDTLAGRGNAQCIMAMSIFDDDNDSASGTPTVQLESSGLFADSIRYEINTDGPSTESVTLRGDHLKWRTSGFTFTGTIFDNTDEPLALTSGLGGVQLKENIVFAGATLDDVTILPKGVSGIPGISSSGTNDKTNDTFGEHIQSINVSTDLNREPILELGRRNFYFRPISFPIPVTTEITVTSTNGHQIDLLPDGVASGDNVFNQRIVVQMEDSTRIDCGTKNKLRSVTIGNLSSDGGNMQDVFSYENRNSLSVSQDQNPN